VGVPTIAPQLWEHLEHAGVTDVAGVWAFSNQLLVVVCLRQRYAGHAKQALLAASGFRNASMNGYYVAVDDDIDPSNLEEVVWAMTTRGDPARSVEILHGAWTASLDPRLTPAQRQSGDLTVGRVLIDACRPFEWREQFPRPNVFSREDRRAVEARWGALLDGLTARRKGAEAR